VYGGYGTEPEPAQLGPISTVVASVDEMTSDSGKMTKSADELVRCLDECVSLRKDMVVMRKFKRNCMRLNFHARKLLQWSNQARTHMFIFNNTINQIGRDAAEDLKKGQQKKMDAVQRTFDLQQKLSDTLEELTVVKKQVEQSRIAHTDLEKKLIETFRMRMTEKQLASPTTTPGGGTSSNLDMTSFNATFNASSLGRSSVGANNLFASVNNATPTAGSKQQQQREKASAAHRALDKMNISSVEMYLLLDRLMTISTIQGHPLSQTVSTAIKRIMMVIEQSIDLDSLLSE